MVVAASGNPIPQENGGQSSGSATLSALRDWFSPVTNYFTDTFPDQTPTDIANNIRESVDDAQKWTQENAHVQTVVEAVKPYWQTAQEAVNNLSMQTFSEIYDDVRTGVQNLDEQIGAINEWNQEK